MAGVGPGDLSDLSQDLLAACIDSLNEIPAALPGLLGAPDRAFVAPGIPVWDCCEQLAVYAPSIGERNTSPPGTGRRHVFGRIPMVRLVTTVTRCLPQGEVTGTRYTPPTPAELDAAAEQIQADGWALHNGIFNRLGQGLLAGGRCSEDDWEGIEAATPAGGCGGWTMTIRFQLDGYGYTDPIGS